MKLGYEFINEEIVLEIGKFAVLWNMFERECKCNASYENIKKFALEIPDEYDKTIFDNYINQINIRAKDICKNENPLDFYVEHKLYPTDDNRARISLTEKEQEMPKVKEFFKNNTRKNLVGAICSIKRIRNNMFHGLKEQFFKEFFVTINKVLEYLLSLNIILQGEE